MAKQKLTILRNIGTQDVQKHGVPPLKEGEVYDASEKEAKVLLHVLKVAEPFDDKRRVEAVPVEPVQRAVPGPAQRVPDEKPKR